MIIKKLNVVFHRHSRWLFGVFTVVIIISFLGFLTPGRFGCDFSDPMTNKIGMAFGKSVTYRDLQEISRNIQIINQALYGLPNRDLEVQNLFGPYCLLKMAEKSGIVASDKEVAQMLTQMPAFQQDGKFSMKLYKEMLSNYQKGGISVDDFNNAIRMMVILNKQDREIVSSVMVTPGEVESFYRRVYGQYRVKGAIFKGDAFKDQVVKDAKKMQDYFENNRSKYVIKGKLSALVAMFPYSASVPEAARAASAAELEKFYKENITQFNDKDGKTQEYAAVAVEVKKKFIESRSRDLAARRAYDFASSVYELVSEAENKAEVFRKQAQKQSLNDKLEIKIIETGLFDTDALEVAKIKSPELIRQLGAALGSGNPVTNAVSGDDGVYVGFTLEQIPPRPAKLNEVAKQLSDDYIAAEAVKLALEAAKTSLEQIKPLKAAERSKAFAGLKKCKIEQFTASTSQPPPAGFENVMPTVVQLHIGELTEVIPLPDGAVIAELQERLPADMKEFESKKELYNSILRQRKEQLARVAFEEELSSQCYMLEDQRARQ